MKSSGASIAHRDAKDSHVLILRQGDALERLTLWDRAAVPVEIRRQRIPGAIAAVAVWHRDKSRLTVILLRFGPVAHRRPTGYGRATPGTGPDNGR